MDTVSIDLNTAIETLPIPALTVGEEYTIEDCNDNWVDAVKAVTADDIIGQSALDFIPEPEHEMAKERLDRAIADNESVEQREYFFRTLDGKQKKATGTINPVEGTKLALVTLKDVSNIEQSEFEIEKRRQQIEELHRISLEISASTTETEICDHVIYAMEKILDLDVSLVGLVKNGRWQHGASSETYPVESFQTVPPKREHLDGKAFLNQETILINDGDNHPEVNSETPYESILLVPIGEIGIIEGLSYEKNSFDQTDRDLLTIIASHAKGAFERLERESQLETRKENLEVLKTIYSRVFRHNFRNEAIIIKGNGEMIERQADDQQVVDAAKKIVSATDRLVGHSEKARSLKAVVDSSREQAAISVERKVEKAVASVQSDYPMANISSDVADVTAKAHPKFDVAVKNAVENAIEHNDTDVTVSVTSTVDEETVTVRIADDGDGISDDEIRTIQDESETDLIHSSGVGLWSIKFITRMSGGELSLDNTDDGARVEIQLDLEN